MSEPIAEVVDGFGQMDVSQVSTHRWRVTSWRQDEPHGYEVDLHEPSCTCPDWTYNRQNQEVCDHFLKVNHVAETRMDVESQAVYQMGDIVERARDALNDIKDVRDVTQATQTANAAAAAAADRADGDSEPDVDPVEGMEQTLREHDLDPDDFEIWIDDDLGSLQITIDGYLDDDEFKIWTSLSEEIGLGYDAENDRNYLKEDDFHEVL